MANSVVVQLSISICCPNGPYFQCDACVRGRVAISDAFSWDETVTFTGGEASKRSCLDEQLLAVKAIPLKESGRSYCLFQTAFSLPMEVDDKVIICASVCNFAVHFSSEESSKQNE
ncbi:hypothetical protein D918_08486 [Trichuris suis]|nr:hypothetical protein D918_08486 [Trichuris suis]